MGRTSLTAAEAMGSRGGHLSAAEAMRSRGGYLKTHQRVLRGNLGKTQGLAHPRWSVSRGVCVPIGLEECEQRCVCPNRARGM